MSRELDGLPSLCGVRVDGLVAAVVALLAVSSPLQTSASVQQAAQSDTTYLEVIGKRVEGEAGVVAAAHPLAADAGAEMLRAGGNAIDAAVSTAFVLGVVEPMMSGVGGGGAMTIWWQDSTRADYIDFYASAGGDPDSELDAMPDSLVSPEREVAVPGTVAGLLAAHERYGALPRRQVMAPAIQAAHDGFLVHPLLARVIEGAEEKLTYHPEAAAIFYPGGEPLQAGDRLVQRALAATLERIAEEGAQGFYEGPTAEATVEMLAAGGSPLTLDDLARFEAEWRRPLCGDYRGHTVLTAPPPLSGAEVLEALELLEAYDLPALGRPYENPEALGLIVDALRLARMDRRAWIGYPNDAAVPAVGMASALYAEERRAEMGGPVPDTTTIGDPWDEDGMALPESCSLLDAFPSTSFPKPEKAAPDSTADEPEEAQTTHLSVVDRVGNAVSLTYTMGLYFGSGAFSGGAFYNSAARNFGGPEANRRGAYRTPRSSTAPTIVLDGGETRLVVGSPGSGRIPPAIVHMILYTLDYGLDPAIAIQMPRVYPMTESPEVEVEGGFTAEALAGLRERGYALDVHAPLDMYFGGVHLVLITEDGTRIGVADPRRAGVARAE